MLRERSFLFWFAVFAPSVLLPVSAVLAQTHSSSNYSVQESGFSSGSQLDANSASYNARVSAGDLGVGQGESANYQVYAGVITPDEEYIELVVPVTNIDLGVLSPGTAGTASATFSARAYLNDNYVVYSMNDAPKNGNGDEINPLTAGGTFNAANEQFGINLVANTAPAAQGADPAPQPNAAFAYGEAAPGYDTADNYRFNRGDAIARSVTRGYGETDFTISYMLNTTVTTPAGLYTMEQNLVITATY